jgi:hypothetical protein
VVEKESGAGNIEGTKDLRELKKFSDQGSDGVLGLFFQAGVGEGVNVLQAGFNHASESREIVEDAVGIMSVVGFQCDCLVHEAGVGGVG